MTSDPGPGTGAPHRLVYFRGDTLDVELLRAAAGDLPGWNNGDRAGITNTDRARTVDVPARCTAALEAVDYQLDEPDRPRLEVTLWHYEVAGLLAMLDAARAWDPSGEVPNPGPGGEPPTSTPTASYWFDPQRPIRATLEGQRQRAFDACKVGNRIP